MVTELWDRVLHQRGEQAALAVTDGSILVHERRTRLVRLDPADGSVAWDVPVGTWPRALVAAGSRVLVLPQDRSALSCLSLATGATRWQADLARFTGHVTVADGAVLTGGWRGYTPLRAFDLTDGRLLWQTPERAVTQRPVAWADGLLLGDGARAWLIDPRTGHERQSWQLPEAMADADLRGLFTVLDADRCAVRCGPSAVAVLRRTTGRAELLIADENPLHPEAPLLAHGLLWLRRYRTLGGLAVDPADGSTVHRADARIHLARGVLPPASFVTAAGTAVRPDGSTVRLGTRITAVRPLGPGRVLAVTRNSLRAYRL